MSATNIAARCQVALVVFASGGCATAAAATATAIGPPVSSATVICSYAPSQSAVVRGVAATAGGAAVVATSAAQALGLSAVLHSSGAYIFTGTGGYLAGTLGAASALPVVVTVAVATGAGVATLELVCVGTNHPGLVTKVGSAAAEFMKRSRALAASTSERARASVGPLVATSRMVAASVRADAFAYGSRASVRLSEALRPQAK